MAAHPLRHDPRPPNSFCRAHQMAIWDQLACHYSSPSDLNCWPTSESPSIYLPAMCRPVQLSNEIKKREEVVKKSEGGRALAVHCLLQLAWTQGPSWAQLDGEDWSLWGVQLCGNRLLTRAEWLLLVAVSNNFRTWNTILTVHLNGCFVILNCYS